MANAKGFYEKQGWGPDFIVPTRSRIDVPDNECMVSSARRCRTELSSEAWLSAAIAAFRGSK